MGAFSRAKGSREERGLVAHLKALGYEAKRVPLSGMMKGYKHDVEATKEGKTYTFELKTRKDAFKTVYDLYRKNSGSSNIMRFVPPGSTGAIAIGTDLEQVNMTRDVHFFKFPTPTAVEIKTTKRIVGLNALRGGADILVIKDNNKPRLFLRFWL